MTKVAQKFYNILVALVLMAVAGPAFADFQTNTSTQRPTMVKLASDGTTGYSIPSWSANPAVYASFSKTDTGQWVAVNGWNSLVLFVDMTVGGGRSATIYVSVTASVTGAPVGAQHGTTVLAIVESGTYIFNRDQLLGGYAKIRIGANNGATCSVSSLWTAAVVSATSWQSTLANLLTSNDTLNTTLTALLAAQRASVTLLQASTALSVSEWISAVTNAGSATILFPSGTIRFEIRTVLVMSASELITGSWTSCDAAATGFPYISAGNASYESPLGEYGGKSFWLVLPGGGATGQRDKNTYFVCFKK